MPVAAERARHLAEAAEPSVFAGLRRRHPALRVLPLRKPVVLALCRAIEDECAARADRPLLFASFQSTRHYRASAHRWRELSRTARSALVFADFGGSPDPAAEAPLPGPLPGPVEVAVPADSPVNREWVLVCDSEDNPGCVVGWERPAGAGGEERRRRFETLWSVDPSVVRDAARICARLSEEFRPGSRFEHWQALEETPAPASPEARRASGVLDRMLEYLARAAEPGF
jgi:DICT domain-containing protein